MALSDDSQVLQYLTPEQKKSYLHHKKMIEKGILRSGPLGIDSGRVMIEILQNCLRERPFYYSPEYENMFIRVATGIDQHCREIQTRKEQLRKEDGPYYDRNSLPIYGHEAFKQNILRILQELQEYLPEEYEKAIHFLSKAEYKEDLRDPRNPNKKITGRSDGYFSIDGTGRDIGQKNAYEWLREVFLHEVGHCIDLCQWGKTSEEQANAYSSQIINKLKQKQQEKEWKRSLSLFTSARNKESKQEPVTPNISDLSAYRERKHNSPVTLGTENGNAITVTQEQLESGGYLLGVQGVGKSTMLESLILQQIAQNESVIAIDPHGDLINEILARMPAQRIDHTYLLDLKDARDWPFGMNLFALPKGQENNQDAKDAVRNQVMHAFERLWPAVKEGLYFGNVLRPIIATLIERPELTLAHVPRLFYNDTFRDTYTQGIEDYEAAEFWDEYPGWSKSRRERYCDPLLDRIKKLLSDSLIRTILCQSGNKLDLSSAIAQGKIFLLHLPLRDPAYELSAPIIGTIFMTLLHGAVFSLGSIPYAKRPSCTLVIDEFQNFVTEDNEQFFSEARKYRVKQILAHQGTHQLDKSGTTTMKKTATSAHTVVCFRTNKDDAPDMATLFSGIKRRPTIILTDPLDQKDFREHPNVIVREFYRSTVFPLEQGLRKTDKEKLIDSDVTLWLFHDFGFGVVQYQIQQVTRVLNLLNNFFYHSEKDHRIDETRLQAFLFQYTTLCLGPEKKARIEQITTRVVELEKTIAGLRAEIENEIERMPLYHEQNVSWHKRGLEEAKQRGPLLEKVRYGISPHDPFYTELLRSFLPSLEDVKADVFDYQVCDLRENFSDYAAFLWRALLRAFPPSGADTEKYKEQLERISRKCDMWYIDKYCGWYQTDKEVVYYKDVVDYAQTIFRDWMYIPDWGGFTQLQLLMTIVLKLSCYHDAKWISNKDQTRDPKMGFYVTLFMLAFLPLPTYPEWTKLHHKLREELIDRYRVSTRNWPRYRPDDVFKQEFTFEEQQRVLRWSINYHTKELEKHTFDYTYVQNYPRRSDKEMKGHIRERDEIQREKDELLGIGKEIERKIRLVSEALIQEPIAADKAEISVSDISGMLKDLPNFTAYVKTPTRIHRIVTQDLRKTHPAVSDTEAQARRSRILKQTRAKYCREQAQVEAEIRAAPALPNEPPAEPVDERQPTREKSADKPQKPPQTVSKLLTLRDENGMEKTISLTDEEWEQFEQLGKARIDKPQPSRQTVTIIHPDTGEKVDIDAQLYYEANRKFSKLVDYFEDDPYMRTIQEGNILRDLIEQSNRLLSQPQPAPPVDQPPVSPNQAEEPEERMSTLLERDNRQPKQRVTPPDNKTKKPAKPKGGIDNLINEDFIE